MASDHGCSDNDLAGLSIYEVAHRFAHQFPRKRFVVEPLQWTASHLVFLRCAFVEVTPNTPPSGPRPTKEKPWAPKKKITRKQAFQWVADCNHSVFSPVMPLQSLLEAYSFKSVRDCPLVFFFNKHKILLPCEMVSTGPHRKSWKQDHCRIAFSQIHTAIREPRRRRFPLQLEKLGILPENPHVDPYIAALLIAEAQQSQAGSTTLSENATESCYKVHFILADYDDRKNIRVYSAVISTAFLRKLSHPNEKPRSPDSTRFDIRYTTLPYRPKSTFPSRLVGVLLDS
ncbi:transposase [Colletotrichum higginsianum IMI 349063]|uniref:Transposase n=1 Tax=Colletotrichum higginsianum (strain IMI 349063) TaxID=759273 RepID=A0A1B7XYM2_COLHI|nr:transposase [Colletotrichum higginsianum IMI 349063]OBR04844.1 transposase [Colletotrichum higginsianum IMI 349063]